jgi:hypothetical protein
VKHPLSKKLKQPGESTTMNQHPPLHHPLDSQHWFEPPLKDRVIINCFFGLGFQVSTVISIPNQLQQINLQTRKVPNPEQNKTKNNFAKVKAIFSNSSSSFLLPWGRIGRVVMRNYK